MPGQVDNDEIQGRMKDMCGSDNAQSPQCRLDQGYWDALPLATNTIRHPAP